MSNKPKYAIVAGPVKRPETIGKGILEKGSGQTIIAGEVINVMTTRGAVGVPNETDCWGVRLDKEGNIPKDRVDVKDIANYRGQIKPLKWGDPAGQLIVCRYLKGYDSIDRLYQDNVLNAKDYVIASQDTEASADVAMLFMQSGDNFYDPETDKYLVQMLKIHYMNRDSVSKHPNHEVYQFSELNIEMTDENVVKTMDAEFEALKIVREAANDNSFQQLKNLYAIMDGLAEMGVADNQLYPSLNTLAKTRTKDFHDRINEYKKNFSMTLQLLKSYEAIDYTKKGVIAAGLKEKILVAEDIPAKGEDGVNDWLLSNFLTVKSNDIAVKLRTIADNITKTK